MEQVGTVAQLWRYPVKSFQGELVDSLDLAPGGATGDRTLAGRSSFRGLRWLNGSGVGGKVGRRLATRRACGVAGAEHERTWQ